MKTITKQTWLFQALITLACEANAKITKQLWNPDSTNLRIWVVTFLSTQRSAPLSEINTLTAWLTQLHGRISNCIESFNHTEVPSQL